MKNKVYSITNVFGIIIIFALWSIADPQTAFLWSIFLVWLLLGIDERILGGIAILFLTIIPILLSIGNEARAEQLAVYVFFLLCMIVALQIIDLIRNRDNEKS